MIMNIQALTMSSSLKPKTPSLSDTMVRICHIANHSHKIDVSVLENHHVASSFAIMQEKIYNITEGFAKEDFKRFRSLMINSILGTDMSKHFSELGKFKTRLSSPEFNPQSSDKDMTLGLLFHLADISNGTKGWDIC